MTYYGPRQHSPRRQPTRMLTLDQIQQIENTLQELEQEAARWKELAGKWEATAKEEHRKVRQLEEQLQEQQDKVDDAQEQLLQSQAKVVPVTGAAKAEPGEAADETEEGLARMQAALAQAREDYENAKRRLEVRYANLLDENIMEFLRDLLPVLDNLDLAIQHAPADADNEGVKLTQQMFLSTLEKHGVKAIEALGVPFDPANHEALGFREDEKLEPGIVAEVQAPGFTYRDKLLRPVRVFVTPNP